MLERRISRGEFWNVDAKGFGEVRGEGMGVIESIGDHASAEGEREQVEESACSEAT
jgi:hypothetical protein